MEPCLFCKIVTGDIPAATVYEDEHSLIFKDIRPQAPVHLLAIPKVHHAALHEVPEDQMQIFSSLFSAIRTLLTRENLAPGGYRLVINAGPDSGQEVPHIHVHVLGGRNMQWPPG